MTTPLNSARTIGQSNFLVGYFYVVVICWWSLGQKSCVQLGKVHSRKVGLVWLRWASWRLGKGDPPQRSWQTRSLSRRRRSCPWKNQIQTKHGGFEKCFEPDCEHLKMNPIHFCSDKTMYIRLPGLLGEDDEHASLLVEDPLELLVQDHLTQFLLHLNSQCHLIECLKSWKMASIKQNCVL